MAQLSVSANLFRIVYAAVSTEATRYYLNGVFVTPHHEKGVFLVATDGHRMIVAHDETGSADGDHIVSLDKATLKACKPGRHEVTRLSVDGEAATVSVASTHDQENFAPRSMAQGVVVKGQYPDWRRIMPLIEPGAFACPVFNASYVAALASVGQDLASHFGLKTGLVHIVSSDIGAPALVRWPATPQAFAVLMPMRGDHDATLPDWLHATQTEDAAAAA